jgi:DNA-binding NarL/FixJ family response regulator
MRCRKLPVGLVGCGGRILVVDRDARFRASLIALVENAGYEASEVENGEDAVTRALVEPPDVAVVAVELPGISGFEVCRRLRTAIPGIGIVLVSGTRTEPLDRATGLLIGADDYLAKTFAPDELLASILALTRRVNGRPAPAPAPAALRAGLTAREQQVLALLAGGASQADIAEMLVISAKTVAAHIEHILRKLGVNSRAQAVAVAYRDGHVTT